VVIELRSGQRPGVLDLPASGRFPTRSDLKQYEDSLQDQSLAIRFFQPRAQEWLTSWGRCGTTQIVVGREDWLFYRPGIDSVTGPGFLDPQTLRHRVRNWRDAAAADAVVPDPRPAILEFQQQIEAAGARLILLPIPDKASLHAAELCGRRVAAAPAQNLSFAQFVQEIRAAGVEVFDPSPAIIQPGEIRYLAQDTHWTPQWMDLVACGLAAHVRQHLAQNRTLADRAEGSQADGRDGSHALHLEPESIRGLGDLTELLRLTDEQRLFPPQTVTIQRVLDAAGQRVRADSRARVLLLGDSFTNIYSARQMGWGEGAGLAEHLAYHLGQPVDWIARNDAGAHATREMLSSQLALGRNRLAGKRIVIWQFAARELALGDWRSVTLPAP
jgi:alginate O-acetyltransferase complex protein AlgJ